MCCFNSHQTRPLVSGSKRGRTEAERETLQSSYTTLDEKVCEGKKALNNISNQRRKENILKMVEEKFNEKEKNMDEVYSEMHKELSKQHDEIKDYLDKVQASVSLPKNLLKRGIIEEILSSQN